MVDNLFDVILINKENQEKVLNAKEASPCTDVCVIDICTPDSCNDSCWLDFTG